MRVMRVKCLNTGEQVFLTLNKEYVVLDTSIGIISGNKKYVIYDDNGARFPYPDWHFISIKEYRRRKLEKINKL